MFDAAQINSIRTWEIEAIGDAFPPRSAILEVGAGTGQQAAWLAAAGHTVEAIDLATSNRDKPT